MKRQKRDKLDRAHTKGYQAGIGGKAREQCPYQQLSIKSEWLHGCREAITDKNSGLFR